MLQIPKWKALLIIAICLICVYISIPSLFPGIKDSPVANIFPEDQVNLGLDLRGGAYLLLEVDYKAYQKEQIQKSMDQIRMKLKSHKIKASGFSISDNAIKFALKDEAQLQEANKAVREAIGYESEVIADGAVIIVTPSDAKLKNQKNELIAQTIEIVRRRVDETGTKEVDLQRQGDSYILLQVPGLQNPEEIKRLLGKTAKLSFHMVDENASIQDALRGKVPFGSKILPLTDREGMGDRRFLVVKSRAVITGDMLVDARQGIEQQTGRPIVNFKFNNIGAKIFGEVTSKNTGKLFAIVLDNKIISAPSINTPILGGEGYIHGSFTVQSANELATLLRAGALPAPLHIAEERTVGPSLGLDSIEAGKTAVIIGAILVVVFMVLFYSKFGMIANVALIINLFMIMAILALFGATLTLPGIAGMVLTLGMAVDANVLIFERIREEMLKGRTPLAAIESGYKMAFGTILDSNITTVVAAIILYIFGTGPVKGFAITLSIGIICSMFSAISLTKLIVATWYRRTKPSKLPI